MSAFDSYEVAKRAAQARLILLPVFLLLCGAFFKAQILSHGKYAKVSRDDRLRELPLPTPRGVILDRNGTVMAANAPGYSIKLFAEDPDSLRAVVERMRILIPTDSINPDGVVRRWKESRYRPVSVFGSGSDSTVAVLEEHRAVLPGLVIQNEPRRVYPAGPAVAHLLGYIGEINEHEMDGGRFNGVESGDLVGKSGLESEYDSILRGVRGYREVEVTARSVVVRNSVSAGVVIPVPGNPIKTTIDLPLQLYIDSLWRAALPNKAGAVVAMTPQGEILAYLSFPSFDPNAFIGPVDQSAVVDALSGPGRPMFNRVIAARYPPASPWKLATAIMALRRGLVTMDTRMKEPCTGGYQFGNRRWSCWDKKGHGSLTLAQAIATSCDVYFYQLGLLLGKDNILEDGANMGFANKTGIDLEMEKASGFPGVKDYIDSRGKSTWSNGEVLNLAIGQGMNTQSLIGMTSFYAALASDGVRRAPHLFEQRPDAPTVDLKVSPEQLTDLREALADVVKNGTAASSGGTQLRVAGKTGTGQMTGMKLDLGWFIGFAPYDNPKVVIGMVEEEGVHGSLVAPYVVKMISRYLGVGVSAAIPITEDIEDSSAASPPKTKKGKIGGHQ